MRTWGVLLTVSALLGCGNDRKPEPSTEASTTSTTSARKQASPSAPTAAASTSSAAPVASASAAPAAEPPLEPSPRPSKEDWAAAAEVPQTPPVPHCTLKTIREWALATCDSDYF